MTLYPFKVNLQKFLSKKKKKKCQILSCDTLVANERHVIIQSIRDFEKCVKTFWFRSRIGPSGRPKYRLGYLNISANKQLEHNNDDCP
jgi:hypothetical protein